MLTRDNNGLEIFELFHVENPPEEEGMVVRTGFNLVAQGTTVTVGDTFSPVREPVKEPTWLDRAFGFLKNKTEPTEPDVIEIFNDIKNAFVGNPTATQQTIEKVQKAIENAHQNGQTTLAEKFNDQKERIEREIKLIQEGFAVYIDEEDLVNLVRDRDVLKLNWLRHFVRIIPDDVMAELARARKTGLFDNYVVLHYDPENNGAALTRAEEEARKDPILFGVMQCSRRLYFIGDWIDEHCSLTMEKLTDALGKAPEDTMLNDQKILGV